MKNLKLFFCIAIVWSGISILVTGQPSWQVYYSDMYLNPYTAKLAIGINSAGAKFTVNEPGSLNPFEVKVNNVSRLMIKNDGKVGIGTTTPSYLLQTQGDIYANGGWLRVSGTNGLRFETYGGGLYMNDATWIRTYGDKSFYHNAGTMRTDGTFQVGPSGDRFIVNSSGNVGIGKTAPTYKLDVTGDINFTGQLRYNGTPIEIGGGEIYWLPVTGGIYYDQKVGIGITTSPLEMLHVNGNITGKSVDGQYSNLYRFGGLYLTWDGDSYGTSNQHSIRSTYGDAYGDDITVNSYDNVRLNLDANNNNSESYFEVGHHTTGIDQTLFRIVSPTGYTGIGTTSPAYKLDVDGDINFNGQLRYQGTPIEFGGGGDDSYWEVATGGIHYDEKVGIGTDNPQADLDISDFTESGSTLRLYRKYLDDDGRTYRDVWDIKNDGALRFRCGTSISTDFPETVPVLTLFSGSANLYGDLTVFDNLLIGSGGSGVIMYLNDDLIIENNGNQAIIIENDGRVKVNGTLEAEKVEVKANIIPDYVFQKEYNLRPLTEVESYISANRHLPDVPSATEIEQNGMDIGEMQSVMLRKIEELTLYIIELQKEIEQLKEEKAGE